MGALFPVGNQNGVWQSQKENVFGNLMSLILEGADRRLLGRVAMVCTQFRNEATEFYHQTVVLKETRVLWLPEGFSDPVVMRVVERSEEVIAQSTDGEYRSFAAVEDRFIKRDDEALGVLTTIEPKRMQQLCTATAPTRVRYELEDQVSHAEWRASRELYYEQPTHFSQLARVQSGLTDRQFRASAASQLISTLFECNFFYAGLKRFEMLIREFGNNLFHSLVFNIGRSLCKVGRMEELVFLSRKLEGKSRDRLMLELLFALSDDYQFERFDRLFAAMEGKIDLGVRNYERVHYLHMVKCIEGGEYGRALTQLKALASSNIAHNAIYEAAQLFYLIREKEAGIAFCNQFKSHVVAVREGNDEGQVHESVQVANIDNYIGHFNALNESEEQELIAREVGMELVVRSAFLRVADYGDHKWYFTSGERISEYTAHYLQGELYKTVPF
ncbi:MAG: hypothetical protein S4CHLAM102_07000 [Chlamydiia bacterium]|nr:hypothetical protein [Chlamydiia bacterium]